MFLKKKEEPTCSAQGGGACGGGAVTTAPKVETEATKLSKKQLLKIVRSCSCLHVPGFFLCVFHVCVLLCYSPRLHWRAAEGDGRTRHVIKLSVFNKCRLIYVIVSAMFV